MFIKRTVKKQGNKEYPSIALVKGYRENGKVKHETIANLSKWDTKLVDGLERLLKGEKFANKDNSLDLNSIESGKSIGAIYVLDKLAESLGIKKALESSPDSKLLLSIIYGRILNQGSRLSLVSWQNNQAIKEVLGIEKFNEDQLYRAMDRLDIDQEEIETKLWKYRYGNKPPELFLYDVTSSYFEGNCNELADYGYNRDGKKYKKQIVIGLLTDQEGMPVAIRVFRGNTQDPKTVETQINTLANKFGVDRITFVGDRGMIKSAQKTQIEDKRWYWITATTKAQMNTLIKEDVIQLSLFEETLCEVIKDNIRYILRRNPVRMKEIRDSRQSKADKLSKKIEESNKYLAEHPKAKVDTQVKNLNSYINSRNLKNYIKLETNDKLIKVIKDENALRKLQELDGCYVIQTNAPKEHINAETVHSRYKDLAEIEEHFKNMKTTSLEIRPIFHRKAERTRALVFITMLARIITKVFDEKTRSVDCALDQKIKALNYVQYNTVDIEGGKIKFIPKIIDETTNKILESLSIKLPQVLQPEVVEN
jgi:transposase